jgi:hypothetical protein
MRASIIRVLHFGQRGRPIGAVVLGIGRFEIIVRIFPLPLGAKAHSAPNHRNLSPIDDMEI